MQILNYPGAKFRLAPWLISQFPPHDVYAEPFCGSAAVLLQKQPARIETINDSDDLVINLFRVLRQEDKATELARLIDFTPWSRSELYNARTLLESSFSTDLERAWAFLVKTHFAISGGQKYTSGFRQSVASSGPVVTKRWNAMPDALYNVAARLKCVQIEHMDGVELIRKWGRNGTETFLYVDPPYVLETRKRGLYAHEMTDSHHEELLDACLKASCNVALSGYENPMYADALSGWERRTVRVRANSGQSRTEVLWMNYPPTEQTLC